jgi:hypothetical protein
MAETSLRVFSRKREYHHSRPKDGKDLSKEDVHLVNSAFTTLKQMIKT